MYGFRWVVAAIGVGLLAHPAQAQDAGATRAILDRLDQLERQNRQLLDEIKELRTQVAASSTPPNNQPVEERQEVTDHRVEELAQTKVEASQRFPVKLTGTLLFNAFSNGPYNGGAQNPVVAAAVRGRANSSASLRQTVLGLTFDGPKTLWGGQVSGSVYMDFFAGGSGSLNHLVRLRVATLQFDWANTTFAVGQDKPLVSRREPNSLAQVGVSPLTGAGNPWLWQPQARLEQRLTIARNTVLKAEGGIFQTAETANQPANVANQIEAARPSLETRVAVRHAFDDVRALEVAGVAHWSTSHIAGNSIASRLYGVDWLYRPSQKVEVTGLLFRGRNFANLGALGGIRLDGSRAIAVHGSGGWGQFRYLATPKLTFNVYAGLQDDRNRDLESGRVARNRYAAANFMYMLAPNVMAAFEVGQNRTNYLGIGDRLNNHYDLALAYMF